MCSKLFDEAQNEAQDELIKVITDKLQSPRIRFLEKDERTLTEEELEEQYKIYNVFIFITNHSKKSKKTEYKVKVGKNFSLELFGSGLTYEVESSLRSWGRSAASILVSYFKDLYDGLYIGVLRFDLLSKDKKNFIIPNFRLESNLYLYSSIAEANAAQVLYDKSLRTDYEFDASNSIPFEKYVQDRMADKLQMEQFRAMLESNSNKT